MAYCGCASWKVKSASDALHTGRECLLNRLLTISVVIWHHFSMLRQNYRHSMNHFGQYIWFFSKARSLAISEQSLGVRHLGQLVFIHVYVLKGSSKVGWVHRLLWSSYCNRYLWCTIWCQTATCWNAAAGKPTHLHRRMFFCCTPRFNYLCNCSSGWLDVWGTTAFCCGSIRVRYFKGFAGFQLSLRKHHTKP